MIYQAISFGLLTLLCFALAIYVFRKGHPFNVLALVIFNCGLCVLDVALFALGSYFEFHITSYSSLIAPLGLIVFFRNLHTRKFSRIDKVLIGIGLAEYLLIGFVYIIYFTVGDQFFEKIPSKQVLESIARDVVAPRKHAIFFAFAKDIILFLVQLLIFPFALFYVWQSLKSAKKRHLDFFTSDSFNFYIWNFRFILLIAICYLPVGAIIFHDFFFTHIPILRSLAYILIAILGLGLGILAFFSPVLIKEKGFPKLIEHIQNATLNSDQEPQNPKIDNYKSKLLKEMEDRQVFLDPSLTLSSLAAKLDISSRQLSRIINEHLGKRFSDFVNGYRVEYVKDKLNDKAYDHYAILSIGLEAGFNSKTTFYSAFKKYTGLNPVQFKEKND